METKYQEAINTIIGKSYPKPIVIHEQARAAALKAFQTLKNQKPLSLTNNEKIFLNIFKNGLYL